MVRIAGLTKIVLSLATLLLQVERTCIPLTACEAGIRELRVISVVQGTHSTINLV